MSLVYTKSCFPSQALRMLFPLCAEDVSLTYHLCESPAPVPVSETLHDFKVDCTVPWIRVLCSSLQMVLIIVFNGADIVDDGLESLLAQWTLCLYLQDKYIKPQTLQSIILYPLHNIQCGPGSSVGIAADYGLDGPGSNPGGDEIFPPVQTGPGAHPASCKMGTGSSQG